MSIGLTKKEVVSFFAKPNWTFNILQLKRVINCLLENGEFHDDSCSNICAKKICWQTKTNDSITLFWLQRNFFFALAKLFFPCLSKVKLETCLMAICRLWFSLLLLVIFLSVSIWSNLYGFTQSSSQRNHFIIYSNNFDIYFQL